MLKIHAMRPAGTLLALLLVAYATTARSQDTPPDRAPSTPPVEVTSPASASGGAGGQRAVGTFGGITNASTVYSVPAVPKPAYMDPFIDPVFGSTVMRIANNSGKATSPISGTWGADARHTYSKQQPWNSDGTLYSIQNRSGGSPGQMILDGTTFAPLFAPCSAVGLYDYRWHPSKRHPKEMINVNSSGTELSWVDVTSCVKTRTWTLPLKADYGIGSGEGNPSNDGRFVAIGNQTQMVVVDMDPQPPYAPYPSKRIG